MKSFLILAFSLFCSNVIMSQNLEENLSVGFETTDNVNVSSVPASPSIVYDIDSYEHKAYSFRASSPEATEYEWNIQGGSNIVNIFYRGTSEMVVQFKEESPGVQVVCRAKNNAGWSDYTVISVNITF